MSENEAAVHKAAVHNGQALTLAILCLQVLDPTIGYNCKPQTPNPKPQTTNPYPGGAPGPVLARPQELPDAHFRALDPLS
jgi:hypothetical protein